MPRGNYPKLSKLIHEMSTFEDFNPNTESLPFKDNDKVKSEILSNVLREKYGLKEEDFLSA